MTEVSRRPRPSGRRLLRALVAALVLTVVVSTGASIDVRAAALSDTVTSIRVSNRAFSPNGDGVRDSAQLRFSLRRAAKVTVHVLDQRGAVARTLVSGRRMAKGGHVIAWNGRLANGRLAADAGYRMRLTVANGLGTFTSDVKVVKASLPVYPAAAGSITIALDPGHGGPDPGAIRNGLRESAANLDIALRLRAMLEGAGVRVVMTRTTDSRVNRRRIDWTGDGVVTIRDELASRIEVANAAAADLLVSIHNNAFPTTVGGTEVWYTRDRSFATENRVLASLLQARLMAQLRTLRTGRWRPTDLGIKRRQFYLLAPHRIGFLPRPSLMPAVVGESLSMSHPYENRLLKGALGRQRIAEAYYEAIARYFALREFGARYTLLEGPGEALPAGTTAVTRVRVTNTSRRTWGAGAVALTLSAVRAVPHYDGTGAAGRRLAAVLLARALAPGASVDIEVPFTVPDYESFATTSGRVILKVDLVKGRSSFARHGVAPLQVPATIGSMLFSQDRDALARSVRLGFTLKRAARVTWQITNASGTVVLTRYANRTLRAGAYAFGWTGLNSAGRQVPRGTYTSRLTIRQGGRSVTIRRSIVNAPFRIAPSDSTPARGQRIAVTILSAERLRANPVVVVSQPGRASVTVRTRKVGGSTYRATVTFRAGAPGVAAIRVSGYDVRGGYNSHTVALPLR